MKNQNTDFDLFSNTEVFENISSEEMDKLIAEMESYTIETPDQNEINSTIEILRQYVPSKPHKISLRNKFYDLICNALNEIKFMSKTFWAVSFIIFLFGFYFSQADIDISYKPYIIIMLMAPVPFIFGIIELYRGRDEGVLEIELSCKISVREIMLSRLLVIGIYNVILNTLLSVILSSYNIGISIWRAAFFWITPFTVICGLALVLSSKIRGGYAVTVLVSSWMVFIISVISQKQIIEKLVTLNIWAYIFVSALGILFTAYQVKLTLNKYINLTGGSDKIESKN